MNLLCNTEIYDLYQRDLVFFRNQGVVIEILIVKEQEWGVLALGRRGEEWSKIPRHSIVGQSKAVDRSTCKSPVQDLLVIQNWEEKKFLEVNLDRNKGLFFFFPIVTWVIHLEIKLWCLHFSFWNSSIGNVTWYYPKECLQPLLPPK